MMSWKNRCRACDAVCKEADLILYVVDSSRPLDENDRQIIEMIRDQKVIVLLNKSDLEAAVSETDLQEAFGGREVSMIRTSAKKNAGIEEFEQLLEQMFFHGEIRSEDEVVITSMRHKEALCEAYDSLKMVQKSLEDDMPEDFYSIDLMSAYASLGRIIGEEVGDDLVNEIFPNFAWENDLTRCRKVLKRYFLKLEKPGSEKSLGKGFVNGFEQRQ